MTSVNRITSAWACVLLGLAACGGKELTGPSEDGGKGAASSTSSSGAGPSDAGLADGQPACDAGAAYERMCLLCGKDNNWDCSGGMVVPPCPVGIACSPGPGPWWFCLPTRLDGGGDVPQWMNTVTLNDMIVSCPQ
jgi:hypothetical protein